MRLETRDRVCAFWSRFFDLPVERLSAPGVTVSPSSDGWPGIVVAGDSTAVHVRCPEDVAGMLTARLSGLAPRLLWRPETWTRMSGLRVGAVLGPSVHAYADDVAALPSADPRVREVPSDVVLALKPRVPPEEWAESGLTGEVLRAFSLREHDQVVAAAVLSDFDGMAADVGLLTDPLTRGRGHGRAVAAAAVRSALVEHGICRWRALATNLPSRGLAHRLGFTDFGANLAVRLDADG